MAEKVSPTLANNVHQVLVSCLGTAFRTRKLARNPIAELAKVPVRGDVNHGKVLDDEELQTLVQGFKGTVLYPIVAVAAFTGARRNEILSLRWDDLNIADSTLRIERTLEETDRFGLRTKEPKTARGERTIKIDGDLLSLLLAERDRHLRIAAGIPDSAPVDLSLVKLPTGALMFPSSPPRGESFSFTRLRNPRVVTAAFVRRAAKLGFPGLRFHDLRGSHETLLLDRGVPVHTVAARCGHDPAVLLRSYAKRTRKADDKAAEVIAAISKRALR